MPFGLPRGQGQGMREQESPPLRVIADARWYARQKRYECGFKSILKQEGEIEFLPAPGTYLIPGVSQALTIVRENFIDKVRADKDVSGARTRNQSDVCLRQDSAQFAQGRHGHHRVAHPVRDAYDQALDIIQR